jgi:uncharacterized protein DUF4238
MAELADALASAAKTDRLANGVPSTKPAENAGFVVCGHWRTLAGFAGNWAQIGHGPGARRFRRAGVQSWHEGITRIAMPIPRAHHYIPVFYLKGFTSPNVNEKEYLWVYEQGKPIRKSKPLNEAHQRDFYSFEDEDGKRHDLEQALSQIESEVAPLFRAINDGYYRFHPNDFDGLTFFMALLWVRGPFGRDLVSGLSAHVMKHVTKKSAEDGAKFARKYEEFLNESGTNTHLSAEEMRAFILSDNWEVEQKSYGYTLRKMFEGIPFVSSILREKSWEVLISQDDNYFCTSDFPIVTIIPGDGEATIGAGFGMPGVEVFFPLTKRSCLLLRDGARGTGRLVSGKLVREINKFLMVGARRYIYTCEKNTAMRKVFNRIGCKSVPGKNAFMRDPYPTPRQQATEL